MRIEIHKYTGEITLSRITGACLQLSKFYPSAVHSVRTSQLGAMRLHYKVLFLRSHQPDQEIFYFFSLIYRMQ